MDPKMQMNYLDYNRKAWNHLVKSGNKWTQPVSDDVIEAAKAGKWSLVLTPSKSVPASWYAPAGSNVLGLASGGGQQGPVLAAAGYNVTIFDNSPAQLDQDVEVATRHSLKLTTVQGDMADLSVFPDESFDMVFIAAVMHHIDFSLHAGLLKEIYRVLKKGGRLYLFEHNPLNPVTRYLVNTCVFDKEAKLLGHRYTKNILESTQFKQIENRFILFFPRSGLFAKLVKMENKLAWLPLGGQYMYRAVK